MKILQVVPYFPPAYSFGGPVKVAYQVSRELVKRGHEVVVYTTDARDLDSKLTVDSENIVDGIKVYYMRNLAFMPIKKTKLFITTEIVSRMKHESKKFDIIHLHEYRTYQNFIVHYYAKKFGIPYVLQAHGSLPRIIAKQRLKWIYDVFVGYRLLRDASKVFALSQIEAEQYRAMGVPEEKIEIIPNGIDLSEFIDLPPKNYFRKKFGIDEDEKILLYLGRIHESKGLDLLAEAFSIVSKKVERTRLVIVGPDDGYASMLSWLISNLGIEEKVFSTGFVEKNDKMAALVDSDVLIVPRYNGFPITFLEACLARCPIVTTSNELDWIQNNVGYVTENSPTALSKAITKILQNKQTRERFRANCVNTIREFDIYATTSQIENQYYSIVTNHKLCVSILR